MSVVRILSRAFVAVALVATVLTVTASSVSAQSDGPAVQVITFENEDDRYDNVHWQVRVTVTSLGNCTPDQGLGAEGYVSGWLGEGSQGGSALNLAVCAYEITAQARRGTNEVCDALVAWGTDPADGAYQNRLSTGSRQGETRVSVKHRPLTGTGDADMGISSGGICAAAVSVTFEIDPELVVLGLPDDAKDKDLEERVKRAVEVTDFAVRVRPHESTRNQAGCNLLLAFTLQGGEENSVRKEFDGIPVDQTCRFRAFIVNDPAPFVVFDPATTFVTRSGSVTVDLSGQVKIAPARIAIIQDVVGDASDHGVSYSIIRSCAGVDALPPPIVPTGGPGLYRLPGGDWRASLIEGRYTVHANYAPNFGPGATYHAAARSTTSNVVEGCTVTVEIEHVPPGCVVAGGNAQRLTWRKSRQFKHFDFEFDIFCDGVVAGPVVVEDLPPTPPDVEVAGTGSTSPDVRIVARRLSSGKIEFALQQRQSANTWSGELLPRARLFPTTTARVDSWLQSTPLQVTVAAHADEFVADLGVRIVARKRSNGSVEFALQQRQNDGSWGSRLMLTRRFFPPDAVIGRWLRSSVLTLNGN